MSDTFWSEYSGHDGETDDEMEAMADAMRSGRGGTYYEFTVAEKQVPDEVRAVYDRVRADFPPILDYRQIDALRDAFKAAMRER